MKRTIAINFTLCGCVLLPATGNLHAAEAANNVPAPPSAGLLNDWLREQAPGFTPWDFGGQTRVRYEFKQYMDIAGQPSQVAFRRENVEAENAYLLIRQRVHAGYNQDWVNVFVEGQESSSTGDKRDPNLESDLFDLHQGFLTLGNSVKFPLVLKAGRQELAYGDERLVGAFDWNNIGRSFDALKLRYSITANSWVDGFVGRVVIPKDNHFDVSNEYDTLSGIYASTRDLLPWQESQIYFLARNASENSPNSQTGVLVPLASPRDIYTPGLRFKSLPGKLHGFDYTVEADYQFGRYVAATGTPPNVVIGKSLSQDAYMFHLEGGYTLSNAWSPRLALEYNYASGDRNSTDGTHGTFDTLFPTTHALVGIMDLYSMQNIEDVRLNLSVKPTKKFTVFTSYRGVWLATAGDSFYLSNQTPRTGGTVNGHNGYAINPSYNRFVGTEADLVLTYNFTPYAQLQGGYGHFFVGDYVKQSLSAPGFGFTDANYAYVQATFRF